MAPVLLALLARTARAEDPAAETTTDPSPGAAGAPLPQGEGEEAPPVPVPVPAPDPTAATTTPEGPAPVPAPVPDLTPPPLTLLADDDAPGGWIARGADGHTLTTLELATALGDTETLTRLRRARTFARVEDGVFAAGAVALTTIGVLELVQAGPALPVGARPDPQDYPAYADWYADESMWEHRLANADTHDEKVWTGVTLISGAALCGVLIPLTGQELRLERLHPGLAYERAAVQARIGPGSVTITGTLP